MKIKDLANKIDGHFGKSIEDREAMKVSLTRIETRLNEINGKVKRHDDYIEKDKKFKYGAVPIVGTLLALAGASLKTLWDKLHG
jgi:hypothetical protein